jgi:glycine cleavage system H protein
MNIRSGLYYTPEHVWGKTEGNEVLLIGITDFGQESMGEIAFVELPAVGKEVKKSDIIIAVGSSKAFVDLPSPVSGTVLAINETANLDPVLINNSPYDDGWLVKIQVSNPAELTEMMDSAAYSDFLAKETG